MSDISRQWDEFPAIASAQQWSLAAIARLQSALESRLSQLNHVATVAVSGSLARLDASENSDVDLIIVLEDGLTNHPDDMRAIAKEIYIAANACGLKSSAAKGIYATPSTLLALNNPDTLGQVNEDMILFGHRMQLLIESRPICREDNYRAVIKTLLDRYMTPFAMGSGFDAVSYLLNDLIRYYRSYLVAKQWNANQTGDGWYLKQVKVRHSRLLAYASTLLLLAEAASKPIIDQPALQERLASRPLDRIAQLFEKYGTDATPVFKAYDRFLESMSDPSCREELGRQGTLPIDPAGGQIPPAYFDLVKNGEQIAAAMIQFVVDHFHECAGKFLQRVVF